MPDRPLSESRIDRRNKGRGGKIAIPAAADAAVDRSGRVRCRPAVPRPICSIPSLRRRRARRSDDQRKPARMTVATASDAGRPIRIAHLADTHLGYRAFYRADPITGRNQRAIDIERAFEAAIDDILTRDVDLVIHAGDVFHHTRPSWQAMRCFVLETRRLEAAGMPAVVIAGNHDTPRLRTTGSVFAVARAGAARRPLRRRLRAGRGRLSRPRSASSTPCPTAR